MLHLFLASVETGPSLCVQKYTLTLQRISSFLNDEENQSREEEEEEEESRTPSSVDGDAFPDCLELTMTLDGATDPFFLGNLNKDVLVELVLSAEGKLRVELYFHTIHIKRQS